MRFEECRRISTVAFVLSSFTVLALQAEAQTAAEKRAADSVANLVQQIRSQSRLPALERMEDPFLHDQACARAKDDTTASVTSTAVTARNGVVTLAQIAYSTSDPGQPTKELETWAAQKDTRNPARFAVGACFLDNAYYPGGRYWIEVGTYMGPTKSFFYRAGSAIARLWSR